MEYTVQRHETDYYGIYVEYQNEQYWIVDNNGNDDYYGIIKPTNDNIKRFRDEVA